MKNVQFLELLINSESVAKSLCVSTAFVNKRFRDGRVASPWAEGWASQLYGFRITESNDAHDGFARHPMLGTASVSVRSLSKSGVKFQNSKFIGSGRSCSVQDLRDSINSVDVFIVTDIIDFPTVRMIPVASEEVIAHAGTLVKPCGVRPDVFYNLFVPDGTKWKRIKLN